MSHVAVQETKPGEPMFKDMEALNMACAMLGLEVVQKSTYTWYNKHMGDYPLPKGVKVSDLGHNAKFVVRLNEEGRKKNPKAYEIGMLEDPNNPGCFVPIYDFYAGGFGLEEAIDRPLFNDAGQRSVKMLCPRLKQHYDMCCDALAAKAAGDSIEFLTAKDAHVRYPALFPEATADERTWVSIVNTDARVEATAAPGWSSTGK